MVARSAAEASGRSCPPDGERRLISAMIASSGPRSAAAKSRGVPWLSRSGSAWARVPWRCATSWRLWARISSRITPPHAPIGPSHGELDRHTGRSGPSHDLHTWWFGLDALGDLGHLADLGRHPAAVQLLAGPRDTGRNGLGQAGHVQAGARVEQDHVAGRAELAA